MNKSDSHRRWNPEFPLSPKRVPFFYGWVIVLVGTLGIVCTIPGQTIGVSVFTDTLIERLELTRMQLSTAYLVGTALSGFLLPIGGQLYDKFGSRKTAVLFSFLLGLVLVYLSFSDHFSCLLKGIFGKGHWWVAFAVILFGFFSVRFTAQGMLTMASHAMIGKWFNERRGLIMSISGVAVSLSFSVTPLVLSWLIDLLGWRQTWLAMAGFLIFILALVCYIFFRDNPEECGLEMDGPLKGSGSETLHPDKVIVKDFTRSEALRTMGFWAFAAFFAWLALFGTGYTFHVIAISEEIGMSKNALLYLFFPSSLVGMCSNFAIGYISDRTRIKYILMVTCLAMVLMPVGLLLLPLKAGFVCFVLGFGICNGAYANLSGNVWPRFFGRTHLGSIYSLNSSMAVIGSGIGPALFTVFKDYGPGFSGMFWVGLIVPVGVFVMSFWADNPQRKLVEP
ncbi:MAG: MFS transporter [Opitutaceae bacterium]|nr:MFS transporter [Opitutaceae bacterium]|tara:strand:+ start:2355 stop:3704 length:1350 start_codon:yes stop_codon:yes gene_type:complete